MEIVLYEVSGHMPVGSLRGHLLTTNNNKKKTLRHFYITIQIRLYSFANDIAKNFLHKPTKTKVH